MPIRWTMTMKNRNTIKSNRHIVRNFILLDFQLVTMKFLYKNNSPLETATVLCYFSRGGKSWGCFLYENHRIVEEEFSKVEEEF